MSDWGRARSPLVQVGCQAPRITSQRESWPGHSRLICIWEIKSREAGSICWPGNESNAMYTPAAFNGAITSTKLNLHLFEEGRHLCRKNLKDSTISCSKVLKWPKQRYSHETSRVQSRYKRGRKPFKHLKKKIPVAPEMVVLRHTITPRSQSSALIQPQQDHHSDGSTSRI